MWNRRREGGEPFPYGETRRTRCSNSHESGFEQVDNCLTLSSAERRRFTVTGRRITVDAREQETNDQSMPPFR